MIKGGPALKNGGFRDIKINQPGGGSKRFHFDSHSSVARRLSGVCAGFDPQNSRPRSYGKFKKTVPLRRDGRVVEGARLESVFRGNSNVGSNPTLSAKTYFNLQTPSKLPT